MPRKKQPKKPKVSDKAFYDSVLNQESVKDKDFNYMNRVNDLESPLEVENVALQDKIRTLQRIMLILGLCAVLAAVIALNIFIQVQPLTERPDIAKLGSSYWDTDGNIWFRLDSSDPQQRQLARQIEQTCLTNNIKNCKSSLGTFNIPTYQMGR